MFRWTDLDERLEAVDGLLSAEAWRAEKVAAALSAIAYEETIFTVDELLGWYADVVGEDARLEEALTRLTATVINGDMALVAAAVRRAIHARRVIERAAADACGAD